MIIKIESEYINLDHVSNFYTYYKESKNENVKPSWHLKFHLPNNITKVFQFETLEELESEMLQFEIAILNKWEIYFYGIK